MRIVYGVHGYGRGHASRALAVLPELTARHDVLVLAGGDAYKALCELYKVVRIPVLTYVLGRGGRRRPMTTIIRNLSHLVDIFTCGRRTKHVMAEIEKFRPHVVLSDSESLTHKAAKRLGIPRISFDHFGVMVYCRQQVPLRYRLSHRFEAMSYKLLMSGMADRTIIVSFYDAPGKAPGLRIVGPVLREEVQQAAASDGGYLLVYFSNGDHHYTPHIEAALKSLDCEVRVYGPNKGGRDGNIIYKPLGNLPFIDDLAGCHAVFSTAGNQLISEAIHFGKPMLLMPEDSLEQKINTAAVQKMGAGRGVDRNEVTVALLEEFLAMQPQYAAVLKGSHRDGRREAVDAIERFAAELAGG